jgi:hypothetical protein
MKPASKTRARRGRPPARRRAPLTFDTVCEIARDLPGVEAGTSYGTPALRLKGKFFSRLREDGDSLVVKVDFTERDMLMEADPEVFYITDHYLNYPSVLVRLSKVKRATLADLLRHSWERESKPRSTRAKRK